jgi:hypothetical protein
MFVLLAESLADLASMQLADQGLTLDAWTRIEVPEPMCPPHGDTLGDSDHEPATVREVAWQVG